MGCRGNGCYQFNCSDKHYIFCNLGYPQLDSRTYGDGSWSIIQLLNHAPTPSEQKWNIVMNDIRNLEQSESNFKRLIVLVDPTKDYLWEVEEKRTQDVLREDKELEDMSRAQAREILRKFARSSSFSNFAAEHGWSKALNPHFLMQQIKEHQPQIAREIVKNNGRTEF